MNWPHNVHYSRLGHQYTRVGQGFGVYGIQGSSKLGIRYIYAEIWVLSISFVLLTTNFGYNVL